MQGVSVLLFLGLLAQWSCNAVFLNHRPFPTYSLENMPNTQFSCREKILGGYYADPDTQCQMFHVCVKVAGIGVQDFRFLCPNGTAFDQDHQICADWEDVDCDATTLYYSSDNFDLYRVGSGFESKAHKYGEDEETFALQRAETGDARINREPQTKVVNQQRDHQRSQPKYNNFDNNNNNNNQEKDIFKASSSSNFFNNRNNGKENDEDYDDNVNVNQNRDYEQKRKVVRKQQRRPVQQQQQPTQQQNQQQQTPEPAQPQTRRPQRPTGFVNNFAGSSYGTSTQRAVTSTANNEQTAAVNNNFRRGQRQRNNNYASSSPSTNSPTPTYSISTPAPFRQSPSNNGQYYTSSSTENYPHSRATNPPTNFNTNYDVPKVSKQHTENYPSNNPQYNKPTTPFVSSSTFEKKPTNFKKIDNFKPTTFSPNAKPFSFPNSQNTPQITQNFPTTFAPRTQQAYTQIAQQTQKSQNPTTFNSPSSTFTNQQKTTFAQQQFSTTLRPTSFTQYTPTVPKISSTTPVNPRSNRFDETQYDDGSYNSKYENNNNNNGGEDEFLKTAHSQNIASSRNELARAQKQQQQQSTTQRPSTAYNPTQNYPSFAPTRNTQVTQRPVAETKPPVASTKKVKNVSYDYAYYDSIGSEPDYQIDTEVKKTGAKN